MKPASQNSEPAAIARLVWMMIGPAILLILAILIATRGGGWFTLQDFAFFIVLPILIFARWFEFLDGNPQTSTGEPATLADFRRYVIGVIIIGLGVWTFANLLGNHWPAH